MFEHQRRPVDQARIRQAIARKHVDPADVPATAREPQVPLSHPAPSASTQAKRKVDSLGGPSSSQNRVSSSSQTTNLNTHTQAEIIEIDDDEEEGDVQQEDTDELYCILLSKVVGLQYYRGMDHIVGLKLCLLLTSS